VLASGGYPSRAKHIHLLMCTVCRWRLTYRQPFEGLSVRRAKKPVLGQKRHIRLAVDTPAVRKGLVVLFRAVRPSALRLAALMAVHAAPPAVEVGGT